MTEGRREPPPREKSRRVRSRPTWLAIVATMSAAACGGAASPVPTAAGARSTPARLLAHAGPGAAATLGNLTWHLDQLAPPPTRGPGEPVVLAVLRAADSGTPTTLSTRGITLLDSTGSSWAPAANPVYVPIDGLDGDPIEPGHGAAGTVAFRMPAGRHASAVVIRSGSDEVILDAPR